MNDNPYIAPQASLAPIESEEPAPPLWNPNSAALWSMLLSPVFGATLHMRNWRALGEEDKAITSRNWAIGAAATFLVSMVVALLFPRGDIVVRLLGLGILIGWYVSNAKEQIQYVKDRFGTSYPRKGWLVPILIAVGIFVVLVLVFAFIMGVLYAETGTTDE